MAQDREASLLASKAGIARTKLLMAALAFVAGALALSVPSSASILDRVKSEFMVLHEAAKQYREAVRAEEAHKDGRTAPKS